MHYKKVTYFRGQASPHPPPPTIRSQILWAFIDLARKVLSLNAGFRENLQPLSPHTYTLKYHTHIVVWLSPGLTDLNHLDLNHRLRSRFKSIDFFMTQSSDLNQYF